MGGIHSQGQWRMLGRSRREGAPQLTSRWATVKMTGSMRKTRLDSLLMDAAMTWEFTTREAPPRPPAPASPANFTVAFSVDRKRPRLL
uniref:Uncharacterized protein n=1 Tax=Balaenoptera musculus TaxID=9771 RepID=A0A8C0D976_BALMU